MHAMESFIRKLQVQRLHSSRVSPTFYGVSNSEEHFTTNEAYHCVNMQMLTKWKEIYRIFQSCVT